MNPKFFTCRQTSFSEPNICLLTPRLHIDIYRQARASPHASLERQKSLGGERTNAEFVGVDDVGVGSPGPGKDRSPGANTALDLHIFNDRGERE